jgi:hypothetical protein
LGVPIDDDDLKRLIGDFLDCGDSLGAVFSLNAQARQHLADGVGGSLIGSEQEATKGHALVIQLSVLWLFVLNSPLLTFPF